MSVRVRDVAAWVESLAPAKLAEEWDNVGLQVGSPDAPVDRVVTALTVTPDVIEQAVEVDAQLIIAHHPLIFRPRKSVRRDDRVGTLLYDLIRRDIALLVAHTNLDAARGGVNDGLARRIGLRGCAPLVPGAKRSRERLKLVTFVPAASLDVVRTAMGDAGAGVIGLYSHCTFSAPGEGTFLPLEGARPHIGSVGVPERVEEYRVEAVVDPGDAARVIAALKEAHPYEEVPLDLYPLVAEEELGVGIGRIGELASPMSAEEFIAHLKNVLDIAHLRVAGACRGEVRRVAVVGGAGGRFVEEAHAAGADALVTGDVDFHDADEARHLGLLVVDAGHFGTEKHVPYDLARYVEEQAAKAGWPLSVRVAQEADPLREPKRPVG